MYEQGELVRNTLLLGTDIFHKIVYKFIFAGRYEKFLSNLDTASNTLYIKQAIHIIHWNTS